jgi:Cu-Zn family superoxide dismutase
MNIVRTWFLVPLFCVACGGGTADAPPPETPQSSPPPPVEAPAGEAPAAEAPAEAAPEATGPIEVTVEPKSGSSVGGTATFEEVDGGVKVTLRVANAPAGLKATHIHEKGDCSAPDASSAGDHFNPHAKNHGIPPDEPRHLGDLGNMGVNAAGMGVLSIVVAGANLKKDDPHSFLGRALIIHKKKDDGGQPTGNAGERIGCAVIARK